MTDIHNEVQSEIRDVDGNDIVEETLGEAQAPKAKGAAVDAQPTSEKDSIDSVAKAEAGVKQAPARKGDNKNSEKSALPKSKAAMVNGIYQKANKMAKEDLELFYAEFMAEEIEASEEVVVEDTNAQLEALVESEATLSEEFKEKTALIFEAALRSKLSEEVDRLEAEYAENLSEEVASIKEDLVGKVDSYLNYVVESWMEENKVAIHNGLRTEIAEGFMDKLKDLFTESYIDVPESKVDLVDELAEQVGELEEKLNATTGDAIALAEELEQYKRNAVIAEACRDLADTQIEKLKGLVEGVDFESEGDFRSKVETIKESVFSKDITESVVEAEEEFEIEAEVSSVMADYLTALKKTSKK